MMFLSKFEEQSYALVRIVTGSLFSFHGLQKILGFFADSPMAFGSQMWFGGLIELVGGFLIAFGFKSRYAAFLSSGTMAVAYVQFHWKFQIDANFFPTINQGEMALLYSVIFLLIACKGSGIWSFDSK